MPFEMISLGRGKYEVKNTETGTIHSKHTTKKNAMAQLRILNQVSKGEGVKNELKAKLDEIASQSQQNFIKNEQQRTKPPIIDIKHLVKPAGASVEHKTHIVKLGGVIGIGDHHIAKMGL
jgi:hypothetical protein